MPRMAQWAYDTLSIPAMSSECERLFSGAKLTITAQRKSLLPNIIEAVEMMNSWYKRGRVAFNSTPLHREAILSGLTS